MGFLTEPFQIFHIRLIKHRALIERHGDFVEQLRLILLPRRAQLISADKRPDRAVMINRHIGQGRENYRWASLRQWVILQNLLGLQR